MTSNEFRPTATDGQEPDPFVMTPHGLYRELRRVAFINHDFRERKSGTFSITIEQGDPIHLADYKSGSSEDWEVGKKWPPPRLVDSYTFDGRRTEVGETQNVLEFNYLYTNSMRNIRLPRHIAEYALRGVTNQGEPVDPVDVAGPTTMEHTLEFDIDSEGLELNATETIAYYDHEGDQIAKTSNLLSPDEAEGMTVMPPTDILESEDGAFAELDHTKPINFDSLVDLKAPTSFYNDAADYLERDIGAPTLDDLREISLDLDIEKQELILAYQVLDSMKKAFRRQLGVNI